MDAASSESGLAPQEAPAAIVVDSIVVPFVENKKEAKKMLEDHDPSSTDSTSSQDTSAIAQEDDESGGGLSVNGQPARAVSEEGAVTAVAVVSDDHTSGEDLEPSQTTAESLAIFNLRSTSNQRYQALPTPPPVAELSEGKKAAVIKQVEFYFSDENLPTDKFMKQKMKSGGAQGWVHLQVIANFNKLKKISKDVRAIALALEGSEALVVEKKGGKHFRVRRKTAFKLPDKDGMSDISSRTVLAVNIPPDSSVDSLTIFFSAAGAVETVRIFRKSDPRNKDVQPPVGASREFYATCQYAAAEEAIKAVNELTDRKSWRGGLRVTLANGMSVDKAAAKLRAGRDKRAHKQDREDRSRSPAAGGPTSPRPDGQQRKRRPGIHPPSPAGSRNAREGQARSRSLTELELENVGRGGRVWGSGAGDGGDGLVAELTAPPTRKPRSETNVDALFSGDGDDSPPRHHGGDRLPLKGVVQTVGTDGWSWIKRDGSGSRKSGNRVPFLTADVVTKPGEEPHPLQKGDHVEYRTWRDKEGTLMAVGVERVKERPRQNGAAAAVGAAAKWQTDRATQAHFRMAIGPEEGQTGFAAGRGRPVQTPPPSTREGGDVLRRPRGSSMGGPDSKEFIPASIVAAAAAVAPATPVVVTPAALPVPDPSQFEDAD